MGFAPAGARTRRRGGANPPPRVRSRRGRRDRSPQDLTLERVVRPAGPYALALCTKHASDATRHVRDGTLTTTLRVGERVEVATARQTLDGSVVLRAASEEGLERLRFVLAVDADHTEFLRRFARDPLIGETASRFQGMRQLRMSTLAQTLLRAFCGQLIDSHRARQLECMIVRAVEPRVDGTDLHAPPTCTSLARHAPVRLRQLGLHPSRAAAPVRICRSTDLGRLDAVSAATAPAFIQ